MRLGAYRRAVLEAIDRARDGGLAALRADVLRIGHAPRIGRTVRIKRKPSMGPKVRAPRALGDFRARVKYANELWRDIVRLKQPDGLCARCKERPWTDAMHCFAKGPYPALRFELDNGAPGCRSCHWRIDSDHQAKVDFFTAYIGVEAYERLRLRAQARSKNDLALTIMFLEQKARELGVLPKAKRA